MDVSQINVIEYGELAQQTPETGQDHVGPCGGCKITLHGRLESTARDLYSLNAMAERLEGISTASGQPDGGPIVPFALQIISWFLRALIELLRIILAPFLALARALILVHIIKAEPEHHPEGPGRRQAVVAAAARPVAGPALEVEPEHSCNLSFISRWLLFLFVLSAVLLWTPIRVLTSEIFVGQLVPRGTIAREAAAACEVVSYPQAQCEVSRLLETLYEVCT
ncbi:hypothetical protein FRC07_005580 [Ceratobasidium sp. 392]|nr:hypothetical protein FRC07_005580 [Ceratobasidium sp. 392]